MLQFDIRDNSAEIIRRFHNFRQERIPRAMKDAANATGRYIHAALKSEMQEVFDRPTPWTLGGLRFKLASTKDPLVRIWLEESPGKGTPAAKFLAAQIEGGQRRRKRFERALIQAGLMPPTAYAVPGPWAPLDAYGNVPGSFIVKMLSDIKAFGEQGYRANRRGKRRGYKRTNYFFVPPRGSKIRPGVYKSMPSGIIGAAFLFVPRATYKKRYDFYGVATRAYERKAAQFLAEAIQAQAR